MFFFGLVFVVNSHKTVNHKIDIQPTANTPPTSYKTLKAAIQSQDLEPVKDKTSTLGFQLHLLDLFAQKQGLRLIFEPISDENKLFKKLNQGLVDLHIVKPTHS